MQRGLTIQATVLIVMTAVFALIGCGTNDRYDAERNEEVTAQGMMFCYQCHADAVNPAGLKMVFGNSPAYFGWLNSPHANNEMPPMPPYYGTDASPDNIGFPYFGFSGLGTSSDCSTKCHDQVGDGRRIDDYAAETGDLTFGQAERPVIGCESCHGSGYGHMAEAVPGPDACGQCHNSEFVHNEHHPEGDNIIEDYKSSPHANSTNIYGIAVCSRCHTNEGAKEYIGIVNGTQDMASIAFTLSGSADIESPTPIQCATCHEVHTLDLLGKSSDAGDGTWSDEFKTCTACHQLYDGAGNLHEAFHDGWGSGLVITDTHYDDPLTDTVIEGYIVNATSLRTDDEGTCLDCHNPHNADKTINRQWASSAHGGFILDTADPVTGIGNVTTASAPAWIHGSVSIGPGAACNRCHTSTGFRNFASNPAIYNSDDDTLPAGDLREMLYCWACHTDNVGSLRDPGIFNSTIADYSSTDAIYNAPSGRIESVGDIGASNVCMACHKGRKTGERLKDPSVGTNINFGSNEGHYLAAGGIMFRTIGYEFANSVGSIDLDYSNYVYYGHKNIGTANCSSHGTPCQDDLLEGGPCVGCHLKDSDVGHTLKVVEKDETGTITGLPSNDGVCVNCHAGAYAMTATELEEASEGYANALFALANALDSAGFTPKNYPNADIFSYPYFGSYPPTPMEWTDSNNIGAAFNYTLLMHEPGAFAHNSHYTKLLIFDSIDWMDGDTRSDPSGNFGTDGEIMDGFINATDYPDAYDWFRGHDVPPITNVPRP